MKWTEEKVIKIQKRSFQKELKKVRELPKHVKLQSITIENKIKLLKIRKQAIDQRLTYDIFKMNLLVLNKLKNKKKKKLFK